MDDIVGKWEVPFSDGIHTITFEHGPLSGKRVVQVDKKDVFRVDWMFDLLGDVTFKIGSTPCCIRIEPRGDFELKYTLTVDGKSLKTFTDAQSRILQCWLAQIDGSPVRVVLEKRTLDIYANGKKMDVLHEFTDFGTEMHFVFNGRNCYVRNCSSGRAVQGILHVLFIGDEQIPEANVAQY